VGFDLEVLVTIMHEVLVILFYMLAFTALAEWDMLCHGGTWSQAPCLAASWLFTV
jgi:hypothetical protein